MFFVLPERLFACSYGIPFLLGPSSATIPRKKGVGSSRFFNTFGWARARINHYADEAWKPLKQAMVNAGHKNDIPGEVSGGGLGNATNWLLYGAIAVAGIVLISNISRR